MVRRRPRWILLATILACIGLGWFNLSRTSQSAGRGRQLFLQEGQVEIVQVEDAATFLVRALDGPGEKYNGLFRIRLMGIELPTAADELESGADTRALALTEQFVAQCGQHVVRAVFDRQRFDDKETPLAYFLNGDVCLNAELLKARVVRVKCPEGLPSKWMRDLIKIANESAPLQSPQNASVAEVQLGTVE